MQVAQKKLNENIAEYVLYMYQIEDIIRAYQFDVDIILKNYVKPQLPDVSFINQYREWYKGLVTQMKNQKIEKNGHLVSTQEILIELSYLHNTMVSMENVKYSSLYSHAMNYIDEFKAKSNLKDKNHIEIAFHAMYMKLLLKIQKKEISPETEDAFDSMRIMLAYLSKSYHKMKSGDTDFLKG
jgi:hypothetical protein